MESDFAALVLSGQDPLESISVIYQFTTKFNEYDIPECRMIIILAFVNQKWCAYYWDMGEMKVHIIDPLYGLEVNRPIEDIHRINVEKIQSCLAKIIFLIFEDWKVNWSAFQKNYVKPIISNPKRGDDGLLTLLSIQEFDGSEYVESQTEKSFEAFNKLVLYEMVSLEGNYERLPTGFVEYIL